MAKVIDDSEFESLVKRTGGRTAKYPYDEWFDGQARVLVHGDDFECTPASMKANLDGQAKKKGVKIQARTRDDGNVLVRALLDTSTTSDEADTEGE